MAKINRVAIYDMDGTIVDSSHRYRTIVDESGERIDLDFWRENEALAMQDGLLPLYEQYRKDLQDENCYVIIATARVMNSPDWQFVKEILGEPDYFISRPKDSNISSEFFNSIFKLSIVFKEFSILLTISCLASSVNLFLLNIFFKVSLPNTKCFK